MTNRGVLFAITLCLAASPVLAQRPPQSRPAGHPRPPAAVYRGPTLHAPIKPKALKPMKARTSRIPPPGDPRGALNPQPIPPGKPQL